jgi:hypothetical protein
MKKVTLAKKLALRKATVSNLNAVELHSIKGGAYTLTGVCGSCEPGCEPWTEGPICSSIVDC